MNTKRRINAKICVLILLVAAAAVFALAQSRGAGAAPNNFYRFNYALEEMQPIAYPAQPIATPHQIRLQNETIKYTARVGFTPIRNATSGVSEGHLFYVYYAKDGVTDRSTRPVWFLFNGGANATSFDFSNANIENCFLTCFQAYVRNELDYRNNNICYVSGNAPPWSGEYNTVVNGGRGPGLARGSFSAVLARG